MELAENDQEMAALKIQGLARKRKARKRVKRIGASRKRQAEMEAEGYDASEEQQLAAKKIQTRSRMKRDRRRCKRIADSKNRHTEMQGEGYEWDEEQKQAAEKIQTRSRMKRDRKRVADIKEGSRSAFEMMLAYASAAGVRLVLTLPNGEGNEGTYKLSSQGKHFCGTFQRSENEVTLAAGDDDHSGSAVVQCCDNEMKFTFLSGGKGDGANPCSNELEWLH